MFKKILIANRGAIACRILRTVKRLGIGSVAVYSEADENSMHVRLADEAYCIGPAPAAESYLRAERILEVARQCGAEAIHPGYGFLSENADFAAAVEQAGLAFIGPTPSQMRDFGLKHTAREIAQRCDLPLLPGTELLADLPAALEAAENIGYPVMLKSTAGGGGIGMRRCNSADELGESFAAVQRLAAGNFKNAGVFLEKFVAQARHIEVQLFGDGRGTVIALGERDCSVQRRNQKVIEESPAPGLSDSTRAELHAAAVRLGKAVNYRSAGTVEFVYDTALPKFYFLEVNTRLQVEHGVTEEVGGIDLVEWMIRAAAGEPPDLANHQHVPDGHAIQARIYAEDPARNFRPSSGLITNFDRMSTSRVRVDTWVESGTEVSSFYDPMLAKVIVRGETRKLAIMNLIAALGSAAIDGIETTFRIYLPRHVALPEEVPEAKAEPADLPRKPAADMTGQGTILLVEDEDPVRAVNARALSARGYTVLEAASGPRGPADHRGARRARRPRGLGRGDARDGRADPARRAPQAPSGPEGDLRVRLRGRRLPEEPAGRRGVQLPPQALQPEAARGGGEAGDRRVRSLAILGPLAWCRRAATGCGEGGRPLAVA